MIAAEVSFLAAVIVYVCASKATTCPLISPIAPVAPFLAYANAFPPMSTFVTYPIMRYISKNTQICFRPAMSQTANMLSRLRVANSSRVG